MNCGNSKSGGADDRDSAANRGGFTLIEMLVVISVCGILLALFLPAVQQVRESSRRVQCANNLRQIGIGVHGFESTHGFYPSNGWGFNWVGDPDRGVGPQQPGGWIYQILPFLELASIAKTGSALAASEKAIALGSICSTSVPLFLCPTRPAKGISELNPILSIHDAALQTNVAKTHYAVCEGDFITNTDGGPASLKEGDRPDYLWTDVSRATGVSFLRSRVRVRDVGDGTSNTYFAGEKNVATTGYFTADDDGYDQPLFSGVDLDISRWTIDTPLPDHRVPYVRRFGSAHADGAQFLYCDGSLRIVSFSVNGQVHRHSGTRFDTQ